MKRLFFGALCSLLFLVSGCMHTTDEGGMATRTFVYHNETAVSVRLESYVDGELVKSSIVEPRKSLEQSIQVGFGREPNYDAIMEYDVARVVFGDTKELWCRVSELNTPYNIYNPENLTMTKIDERHLKYDFSIGTAMMDAATGIEVARHSNELIAGW